MGKMEDVQEDASSKDVRMEEEEDKEKLAEEAKNQTYEILMNPSRVLASQAKYISFENEKLEKQRYVPVLPTSRGIIMLDDTTPDEEENILLAEKKPEEPKS